MADTDKSETRSSASGPTEPSIVVWDTARIHREHMWSPPEPEDRNGDWVPDGLGFTVEFLARGGYNDVWLVRPTQNPTYRPFVLRVATEDPAGIFYRRADRNESVASYHISSKKGTDPAVFDAYVRSLTNGAARHEYEFPNVPWQSKIMVLGPEQVLDLEKQTFLLFFSRVRGPAVEDDSWLEGEQRRMMERRTCQVRNEVGWLRWLVQHCPEIPVPKVYAWSDGQAGGCWDLPYIVEEYVEGKMLCDVWMSYTPKEKEAVARRIAEIIVTMGEQRFEKIGGMMVEPRYGRQMLQMPTVEGPKFFKGRERFHHPDYYHTGPYASPREYVLAQYDREIYYHTHAPQELLNADLFEHTSPAAFAKQLKKEREKARLELDTQPSLASEPFVLCHNDLQARNILVSGTEIVAVIDWEFAGAYPLSELNSEEFEVVERGHGDADEPDVAAREEQILFWGRRVQSQLVPEVARERGWVGKEIEVLCCGGREVVGRARVEMTPTVVEVDENSVQDQEGKKEGSVGKAEGAGHEQRGSDHCGCGCVAM